ncbi:Cro/CI family transcriptional regulator [Rhizobium sp. AB2/73]|uniref:transcriptional regulator n=1 Tax=unclassified Rhizobium TaxID=2613769 RepID=UPI000DDA9C42|nr:Cro/CI family transcriptional regulator [Rhizobium sp. AB2/73]QYA12960.1 helix-turn-helix domain-containing protein [Rhizobium sp. AB2/73]UEQ81107.1 helix-turn-helix domain-containing protein [Rhizobium sp. AB2/73]
MRTITPVLKLVFERISASELARRLGITPAAVLQWDRVPVNRVIAVERETGISRHVLRPDIYGTMEAAE